MTVTPFQSESSLDTVTAARARRTRWPAAPRLVQAPVTLTLLIAASARIRAGRSTSYSAVRRVALRASDPSARPVPA
jgi:hypothetical protein